MLCSTIRRPTNCEASSKTVEYKPPNFPHHTKPFHTNIPKPWFSYHIGLIFCVFYFSFGFVFLSVFNLKFFIHKYLCLWTESVSKTENMSTLNVDKKSDLFLTPINFWQCEQAFSSLILNGIVCQIWQLHNGTRLIIVAEQWFFLVEFEM